jgi:hypothetical protein
MKPKWPRMVCQNSSEMTVVGVGVVVVVSGGGVVSSGGVVVGVGVPVSGGVVAGCVVGGVVEVGGGVVVCETVGLDVDVVVQASSVAHSTSVKTAIDQRRKFLIPDRLSGIRCLISL